MSKLEDMTTDELLKILEVLNPLQFIECTEEEKQSLFIVMNQISNELLNRAIVKVIDK